MRWDPDQYVRFADERGRPFFELIGHIEAESPEVVVDLGCGPGDLTASLKELWPDASVSGTDSSPEMIKQAPRHAGVRFHVGSAEEFTAEGVDVLVSNAALQWVPDHRDLLVAWSQQLNAGGWLAFQVPSNFDAPSHRLMRDLAESDTWRWRLHGVLRGADSVASPGEYLGLLAGQGMRVNAWQTEYFHVLPGDDPVLEWVRGTGLRPVLEALSEDEAADFMSEYAQLLREAYPQQPYGTVFPFRRTFVVAVRPLSPHRWV